MLMQQIHKRPPTLGDTMLAIASLSMIEILLISQLLRILEILALRRLQAINSCLGVVGVLLEI
jgi:hypothetical protein